MAYLNPQPVNGNKSNKNAERANEITFFKKYTLDARHVSRTLRWLENLE